METATPLLHILGPFPRLPLQRAQACNLEGIVCQRLLSAHQNLCSPVCSYWTVFPSLSCVALCLRLPWPMGDEQKHVPFTPRRDCPRHNSHHLLFAAPPLWLAEMVTSLGSPWEPLVEGGRASSSLRPRDNRRTASCSPDHAPVLELREEVAAITSGPCYNVGFIC